MGLRPKEKERLERAALFFVVPLGLEPRTY